jgi:hypothetical protein
LHVDAGDCFGTEMQKHCKCKSGVCEGGDADSIIKQLPKSCTSQHVLPFEIGLLIRASKGKTKNVFLTVSCDPQRGIYPDILSDIYSGILSDTLTLTDRYFENLIWHCSWPY